MTQLNKPVSRDTTEQIGAKSHAMTIPHNITDCGRIPGETNDCTVRATAHCFDINYADAHARLSELGRKNGKGMHFSRVVDSLGLVRRADLCAMTLKKALPDMNSGRFICLVSRHVFAVIDGIVHDSWKQKPGRRLKMVYENPKGMVNKN